MESTTLTFDIRSLCHFRSNGFLFIQYYDEIFCRSDFYLFGPLDSVQDR